MEELEQYSFNDVMKACIAEFGSDANMESCTNLEELIENIGTSEVHRILNQLNR